MLSSLNEEQFIDFTNKFYSKLIGHNQFKISLKKNMKEGIYIYHRKNIQNYDSTKKDLFLFFQ